MGDCLQKADCLKKTVKRPYNFKIYLNKLFLERLAV